MADDREIETKFWKALKADRTIMLGLVDIDDGAAKPMTAQIEGDEGGPLWVFTAKDTDLVQDVGKGRRAVAHFAGKNHDVFACIHGELAPDNDPEMIDRLWNPFVAAWFEGGKADPSLQLLRFDAETAHIWLNESSLFAGVRILLGHDPKKDYQGKVAEVRL